MGNYPHHRRTPHRKLARKETEVKKYCKAYLIHNGWYQSLPITVTFECVKRPHHFGRHQDAYGGTWKKEK